MNTHRIFDLALITLGFVIAIALYLLLFQGGLESSEILAGSGASAVVFWTAIQLRQGSLSPNESEWILITEQFCLGTGINLLLHALLTYGFYIRRTPFLVIAGGLFAALLLAAGRRFIYRRDHSARRVLIVGFDLIARHFAILGKKTPAGIVGVPADLAPRGIPVLGELNDLREIVGQVRPDGIIVDMKDWGKYIPAALFMEWRRAGIHVEESPLIYERQLSRVCCERLEPMDLLISTALRGDARTMAIQAVYTNVLGLVFLIASLPVLLLGSLAVACFGGPGPVFESVECAGFQYIPFRLLRFRTTSTVGDERRTRGGRLIARLGLVNLPQLINIVRGDMALVGPRPTRRQFAYRLTETMPFYSHRFSVKPGITGWAQVHAPKDPSRGLPEECRDIEYDLFYIKESSLWMDIEILVDALLGSPRRNRRVGT